MEYPRDAGAPQRGGHGAGIVATRHLDPEANLPAARLSGSFSSILAQEGPSGQSAGRVSSLRRVPVTRRPTQG